MKPLEQTYFCKEFLKKVYKTIPPPSFTSSDYFHRNHSSRNTCRKPDKDRGLMSMLSTVMAVGFVCEINVQM